MKYEVIKDCIIKGESCRIGKIVDLDEGLAVSLMGIGRVMPHDESKVENRAIALDEETKPKRRTRKKVEDEAGEE
jgi:hypothetical protein